jgi:hypothetical protein
VTFLDRCYKTWLKRKAVILMRTLEIERLLRDDYDRTVPDSQISEGSTKSTPAVKLAKLRKKLRENGERLPHIQGYWLDQCSLPEGLKGSPKLYQSATVLMGSTALSADQLGEKVWGRPAKSNVENAVSRLIHDWDVPIVKISFHGIRTELCDSNRQLSAVHASTATAQPGAPAEPHKALKLENARREELVENMHHLRALRLEHNST